MIWIALAYHLASRLAYVLYVGLTLKRQDRREYLTRRYGVEPGFQRFRRVAAFVIANDAVSLAFYYLVEKPHFERLRQAPAEPGVRSVPGSARPPSLDTAPGQPP